MRVFKLINKFFKLINKFFKSNYFIPIEIFLAFTFFEIGALLLGFNTVFTIAWGIEIFLIKISFVFLGFFILYKITKKFKKTDKSFKDWILCKK
jgi:hypothetical protein